jgi:hypothetical protein
VPQDVRTCGMLCWLIGAKELPDGTPTTGEDVNVCSSYAACDLLDRIPPNAPLDMDEWCFGDSPEEKEAYQNTCSAGNCCIETTDAGNCFNHEYVCEDYFSCASMNPAFGDMDLDDDSLPDLDIPSDNAINIGDYYGEIVSNVLPLPPADLDSRCYYRIVGNVIDAAYCDGFSKLALDCCIADDPHFNYYLAENKAVYIQYQPCMNID